MVKDVSIENDTLITDTKKYEIELLEDIRNELRELNGKTPII